MSTFPLLALQTDATSNVCITHLNSKNSPSFSFIALQRKKKNRGGVARPRCMRTRTTRSIFLHVKRPPINVTEDKTGTVKPFSFSSPFHPEACCIPYRHGAGFYRVHYAWKYSREPCPESMSLLARALEGVRIQLVQTARKSHFPSNFI